MICIPSLEPVNMITLSMTGNNYFKGENGYGLREEQQREQQLQR